MTKRDSFHSTLVRRENFLDWYLLNRDPIYKDRLLWQACGFKHMVHLLPGETILELGAGEGRFTQSLYQVTRGRNPICAVRFDPNTPEPDAPGDSVKTMCVTSLPNDLKGQKFDYVVAQSILDKENAQLLLDWAHQLLKEGGRVVMYETNPWNPVYRIRNAFRGLIGKPRTESLVSQPELYEMISEIGFIRVSALLTDFVYRPLPKVMFWMLRNLSSILEQMPVVRKFSARILIHAQKPPKNIPRKTVSLFRHEALRDAVSVVIPCHNEEMNIEPLVKGLCDYYSEYIHQIILVDDNSSDDTSGVIERLGQKDPRIVLIRREPPNGVGLAIKDGYAKATGKYILSMDCDFQHLLPELEDIFDGAAENNDAVFGSRFSRHSLLINYPFMKIFSNRAFHLLANILFHQWRRDVTNNLKLMRTDIVKNLKLTEPWFAINAEIGLQLVLMGCTVKEVPISWINRTFDMGHSTFKVLQSGGGYARVLGRLAMESRFGYRPIKRGDPTNEVV